jgi:hypothetical protein
MDAPQHVLRTVAALCGYWMNTDNPDEIEGEAAAWSLIADGPDNHVFIGEGDGSVMVVNTSGYFARVSVYPPDTSPPTHYIDCNGFYEPFNVPKGA